MGAGLGSFALALVLFTSLLVGSAGAQTALDLGTAESFAVLGSAGVTNTGPTIVNGDLGACPTEAITGFPPGVVNGEIHAGDAVCDEARTDATAAYTTAFNLPCSATLSPELAGLTLTGGVYCFTSEAQLSGDMTLSGGPDDVFIFKVGSQLTTASGSTVLLDGVDPCNVFWQVGSSAVLGSSSTFVGTVLAQAAVNVGTGATIEGRLFALVESVTLDTNLITAPECEEPTPEPSPSPTVSPTPEPSPTGPPDDGGTDGDLIGDLIDDGTDGDLMDLIDDGTDGDLFGGDLMDLIDDGTDVELDADEGGDGGDSGDGGDGGDSGDGGGGGDTDADGTDDELIDDEASDDEFILEEASTAITEAATTTQAATTTEAATTTQAAATTEAATTTVDGRKLPRTGNPLPLFPTVVMGLLLILIGNLCLFGAHPATRLALAAGSYQPKRRIPKGRLFSASYRPKRRA